MVGRLGLGIATALSLLSAGGLYAQGMGPAPGSQANISNGYPGPGAYASAAPGSGTQLVSQGLSPFGTNPQPAFGPPGTGPSSVAPAAYSMQDPNSEAGQPGCPGSSAYSKMPGCGAEGSDDFVETPWE